MSVWDAVISRIRDESRTSLKNNRDGVCVITMHVVTDRDGNPIVWAIPRSMRIEPTKSAKDLILLLTEE